MNTENQDRVFVRHSPIVKGDFVQVQFPLFSIWHSKLDGDKWNYSYFNHTEVISSGKKGLAYRFYGHDFVYDDLLNHVETRRVA